MFTTFVLLTTQIKKTNGANNFNYNNNNNNNTTHLETVLGNLRITGNKQRINN